MAEETTHIIIKIILVGFSCSVFSLRIGKGMRDEGVYCVREGPEGRALIGI